MSVSRVELNIEPAKALDMLGLGSLIQKFVFSIQFPAPGPFRSRTKRRRFWSERPKNCLAAEVSMGPVGPEPKTTNQRPFVFLSGIPSAVPSPLILTTAGPEVEKPSWGCVNSQRSFGSF